MVRYFMIGMGIVIGMTLLLGILAGTAQAGQAASVAADGAGWVEGTGLVCLALFAGAVVGFPLASVLVAKPLRNFGRFTIADFLAFRYPDPVLRVGVPLVTVASFGVYIVAQMKAAGIAAKTLLGIPYDVALVAATLVFILNVSVGGMLAVTWTDVVQGLLMLDVVVGTALTLALRAGGTLAPQGLPR